MDRRRLISTAALAGTALAVTRGFAMAEADGDATTKRFEAQRWALDNIIRANGIMAHRTASTTLRNSTSALRRCV
jgi:hypothetical protein